jgi:hypothetical protein
MLIKEICVNDLYEHLINWVLVLVFKNWTLTQKNQIYKALR